MSERFYLRLLETLPYALLAAIVVGFGLFEPRFLRVDNLVAIGNQAAVTGILTAAMTLVIITAGIDLSVGATMYVTAAVMALVASLTGGDPWLLSAAGLATGAILGSVNGGIIAGVGVGAFITTLATMVGFRGIGYMLTQSEDLAFPERLLALNSYHVLGLPAPLLVFIVVCLVGQTFLVRTRQGRQLLALGQDQAAARKAGVPVRHLIFGVYLTAGLLAAVAAIVSASQLRVVTGGFGQMVEFNAIAAAVLGGASLYGGRGSIFPGAFVGALLMQTIVSGLIFLNTDLYLQPVITYTIVFAVILMDGFRDRVQRRLSRRTILKSETASA